MPLPFEPLHPLDENTWDLDELLRDEDERRRRAGYGRHLEMAHVIRKFGDDYLDQARRDWAEKVERDLLPVDYHHLVLTLPRPLTQLVMAHGDVLYSPLMQVGGLRAGASPPLASPVAGDNPSRRRQTSQPARSTMYHGSAPPQTGWKMGKPVWNSTAPARIPPCRSVAGHQTWTPNGRSALRDCG